MGIGESNSGRGPGEVSKVGLSFGAQYFAGSIAVRTDHPNLACATTARQSFVGNFRTVAGKYGCADHVVHFSDFFWLPFGYRNRPQAGWLSGDANRSDETFGVWEPAAKGPESCDRLNRWRQTGVLRCAGGDELQVNALLVGVAQVFAVRRNRSIEDRRVRCVGGQLALIELGERFRVAR